MCSEGSPPVRTPPAVKVVGLLPLGGRGLSRALGIFGAAYAFMHVIPVFLPHELWLQFTWGDALSLMTPYLVGAAALCVLWHARQYPQVPGSTPWATTALVVAGLALYTNGHGINLAANAIARHLGQEPGSDLYRLTYFLDEHLGHILWHAGMVALSLAFLLTRIGPTVVELQTLLPGSLLFAFAYFTDAVEGQTVPMLLPAAVILPVAFLRRGSRHGTPLSRDPILLFFLMGFGTAVVLFFVWFLLQGGFPEFSALGMI